MQPIFITGGTGYIGRRLISLLIKNGYAVTALVRQQSLTKLPPGCTAVVADAFDASTYVRSIAAGSIFIHLLGVSHPGPSKKTLFYSVDLASAKVAADAAAKAGVVHFIYMSVAQYPVKMMTSYQDARLQSEQAIQATGLPATFIRPWYIIGPGHYWPLLLQPLFKLMEFIPATATKATSLALVYLPQLLAILLQAVQQPPKEGTRIIEIAAIRKLKL